MKRWISAALPVVLYAAAIFLLSAQSSLPKTHVWDKAAHFCEYAVLGFLLARAIHLVTGWNLLRCGVLAVLLATGYAFTDEVHQYFVPGRDSDPLDVVADCLGSITGSTAYAAWVGLRARLRGLPEASRSA